MGQSGTALKALLVAAGVIGLVWLLSGFVFAPDLRDTHPLAIAVWLVFGGGMAAVSQRASRSVLLGAAALLTVIAVTDLVTPLLDARADLTRLIASSGYTWIAIAILATNGLVPGRSTASPFRNRTANDS